MIVAVTLIKDIDAGYRDNQHSPLIQTSFDDLSSILRSQTLGIVCLDYGKDELDRFTCDTGFGQGLSGYVDMSV